MTFLSTEYGEIRGWTLLARIQDMIRKTHPARPDMSDDPDAVRALSRLAETAPHLLDDVGAEFAGTTQPYVCAGRG